MRTKTTKAGTRAYSFEDCGDPFLPQGEVLSDAPDANSVRADMERMDRRFDGLHIDAGMGPTAIPSPENAAQHDARGELERRMRDQVLFGPPPDDPFAHGHVMATTAENYIQYAPASEREAIEAVQRQLEDFADDLFAAYADAYPDLARDTEGLSRAITYTMNELASAGENPGRYARKEREKFLDSVATAQRFGWAEDAGRTGGITSGGASHARGASESDKMSDTEWHQAMQRAKGIY